MCFIRGTFIGNIQEPSILLTLSDDDDDEDDDDIVEYISGYILCVCSLLVFRAERRTDVQCSRRAVLSDHLKAQAGRAPLLLAL